MIGIKLSNSKNMKILCLGAHCDDIEIGCGGTIIKWLTDHKDITVQWVVFSKDDAREREATRSANLFLRGAKRRKVVMKEFRNSYFPYMGAEIKEYFEILKDEINPDIVFTHYGNDRHQDHRVISELTWNTFRNHLILEYEIPKYDGDYSSPNFYVPLNEGICRRKVKNITGVFLTQKSKHWFTEDLFWSNLRLRGMESCSSHAEGFYCRKICL
jgi:LmbE family N-acetylglucosaminyl deacetylase